MRSLVIGTLVLGALLVGGCASLLDPDRPFTLIKPEEGWVRLKAPPEDSDAIIDAAGHATREMLNDKKRYKITWFTRRVDDYLIYFQVRDNGDSSCGDEAPEFYKEEGQWAEDRLSRITLCPH